MRTEIETTPLMDEHRQSINTSEEDDLTGCGATACCNPHRTLHRFIVLIFMCILGFGSYFCFDSPGALQGELKKDMKINTAQFASLYSWYSWPNVVLCFVGGFLIDRVFGIRLGTIIFASFVLAGQIVFALGGLFNQFWVMIAGRFIFGIGGESLAVAQNTYTVDWFKGKELNMVFGLQLSIARVGSTVNFYVSGRIYDWMGKFFTGYTHIGVVLMIVSVTCVMSLLSAFILAVFDRRAKQILHKKAGQTGEVIHLSDVRYFPSSFWLMSVICVSYVAIFPFVGLGQVFFQRKYEFSIPEANSVNSIIYIISAVACPALGFLVDKTGRNIFWVFISVLVTLGCHTLLAFTFINPYVPMCIMGLAYSMLASALWPMVALVVPEYQLGTAYGIMQAIQNLGLAVITMIAGIIVDIKGYLWLEIFFLSWLCLALVSAVFIWMFDASQDGYLNMSANARDVYEKELLVAESLERENLLASGSMTDITPHDLLQPQSGFHIRNRYLSRIGATLPAHYNPKVSPMVYRGLR